MIKSIINKINSCLPTLPEEKHVHEPILLNDALKHIKKCIKSTYVSTQGDYIDKFSAKIKNITEANYVLLTNNGTSALHMALMMTDIENCEVLVPSMTFVATVNAIRYVNGIPHFIDTRMNDFNIDTKKLDDYLKKNTLLKGNVCINKKTKKCIKSILIVHAYGYPADISKIIAIAKKYNLGIIEDAAGGLGSYHRLKHVGTYARFGILSFNGNKIITTGMGGALLIKNKRDYLKIKHYISTSRIQHKWVIAHDDIGYNYRMSNINAALGYAQISKLQLIIKKKKILHDKYTKAFIDSSCATIYNSTDNNTPNYWLNNLILNNEFEDQQHNLIKKLHANKIYARYLWTPQHLLSMHQKYPSMNMQNTIDIWRRTISLPSSYIL